jgi:uncharacterized ferritin-like protein (DUF455 family)
VQPPPPGTVERAAWDYVTSRSLAEKLAPPARARSFERDAPVRRVAEPGRPPELRVTHRGIRGRNSTAAALRSAERRAQLAHTFLHHELQAAELMCWAVLAFPDAAPSFRKGLMAVCRDEVRHMAMYAAYLGELGHRVGDFPVRDWFWQRIPSCRTPVEFVATMGIGFEGGNLDHTTRFAARLREAGDERAAALQERIGADEEGHVRFALRWFRRWTGSDAFAAWAESIPAPLSPTVMRGEPIDRAARGRAGLSAAFVHELEGWQARR